MRIYASNLPFRLTEEELRLLFTEFGTIASCQLIQDKKTGKSKGFAFLEMPNQPEAETAMAGLNGRVVLGRPIKVVEARQRSESGPVDTADAS